MTASYHHGNVPEALLEETLRGVDADGVDEFSLRRAAEAVGVTPMAVYRHYPDREGLLRAAAAKALEQLGMDLEARLRGRRSTSTRVRTLLNGYLENAIAQPNRFRLMFGPTGAGHPKGVLGAPPEGPRAQQLFIAAAADLLASRPEGGADPTPLAAMLWAAVHGLATLVIDGPLPAELARQLADRLADAPPLTLGVGAPATAASEHTDRTRSRAREREDQREPVDRTPAKTRPSASST